MPAPVAWVVDRGWHTEIGIAAEQVAGPLAAMRAVFPGAKALMFGFGKRTFITAKVETLAELLLGPVPGPGAIQVTGLAVLPPVAYPIAVAVPLPPGGAAALSDFLWAAMAKARSGQPRLISEGGFSGSVFYAASHGYDLSYTCNTWTVDALHGAGLPVTPDIVLAAGAMWQVAQAPGACRPAS